jgi:hypothetical protein
MGRSVRKEIMDFGVVEVGVNAFTCFYIPDL